VAGRDRGQATPLVAAAVVFAAIVALAFVHAGRVAVDGARPRTAADAAALAGAADGRGPARHLAAVNDGHLVGYRAIGDDVVVEVAVGGVTARARARRDPEP